jgi:digeranylgeranylglycerophospholipid reductase
MGKKGIGFIGLEIDPAWVLADIKKVRLVAPDGTAVEYSRGAESYVVNRELMDSDLVKRAGAAGVHYHAQCPVIFVRQVEKQLYECRCVDTSIFAAVVIIADGVESRIARDLGWSRARALDDIDCCAFGKITHDAIRDDTCVFYVGKTLTPAGYAWVFPRGNRSANVGIGVLGSHSRPGLARELLLSFVRKHYPGTAVADLHGGGAPAGRWLNPLVRDGIMVAGDAAGQINSLTGAGINYSIYAGKLAGTIAAEAFLNGKVRYDHLQKYQKTWNSGLGKQQLRSYALKTIITRISSDRFLNRIAQSMQSGKRKNLSLLNIFLRTFAGHPVALLKALLLFR